MSAQNKVADVSRGTVLIAGTTGWRYVVEDVGDDGVLVRGPNGPLSITMDELQKDIAAGKIQVSS